MGKYNYLAQQPKNLEKQPVHPIWRGIGCLMIVLMPIVAYAAASLLVDAALKYGWVNISRDLTQSVYIPVVLKPVPHLFANLALSIILIFIGYGFLVFLYALVYKFSGTSKMGPYDSPPI